MQGNPKQIHYLQAMIQKQVNIKLLPPDLPHPSQNLICSGWEHLIHNLHQVTTEFFGCPTIM